MNNQSRAMLVQRLEDAHVREKLTAMETDPGLHSAKSTFSANSEKYPDNQMPFVDKHIAYLMNHPNIDPNQYLANLRLMLRRR